MKVIVALCILFVNPFVAEALEKPELHFDRRNWELGYQASQGNQYLAEFVLKGETVENWSELVSAQLFVGVQDEVSLGDFMAKTKEIIFQSCPDVAWNVIHQGDQDLMYEWKIASCPKMQDQHEIARMIKSKEGLHILHYAIKKPEMTPEKREEWIALLNAAQIIE